MLVLVALAATSKFLKLFFILYEALCDFCLWKAVYKYILQEHVF